MHIVSPIAYISRALESVIQKAAREFPVVVLTGPRQSGKTTLLKHLFSRSHRYVSLEPPDVRASAVSDPRGFLDQFPPPVLFDEVSYAPGLLPYIKERVDERRRRAGQYLLTASQNLLLMAGVSESLAGRAAVLRLLPLSWREVQGRSSAPLPWETVAAKNGQGFEEGKSLLTGDRLWEVIVRGGYPELVTQPRRDHGLWYAGYVQTYLERDIRMLRQVGDLTLFQSFLRLLASRSAQLLNVTALACDLGLAVNTVKAWISALEATHQIVVLRPWWAHVGKRLIKTPKVYFLDTGMVCYLTGLDQAAPARSGPMAGALLETAVVAELVKIFTHRGMEPRLTFWRTAAGTEVDLVVEVGRQVIPMEVKLSATPTPRMAASLTLFRREVGTLAREGYLIHPGAVRLPLVPRVLAWPVSAL